ncbi:hypothetical protein Dthio_PD0425 [Desulfonatronospira thiodismutans ASO3-1]|uniref:N6 adenine-specific DNA methyltransferase N-terminal domain-containing protein n=2 Tax=Desulfonatronovibrionaceae TaxID=3031459 RepID=D6SU19_9BACT|nr:hypothetical protein Dthio_PD0425 [Desulfonatronospira thiodismutans ASO3-1]
MHSDSNKRRSFLALLFVAGDVKRLDSQTIRRYYVATKHNNGANLGFENQMWAAADKLRGHMDASEYKYVVLGLIFLKYISDSFQAKYIKHPRFPPRHPPSQTHFRQTACPGCREVC